MTDLQHPPPSAAVRRNGLLGLSLTADVLIRAPAQHVWHVLCDFDGYAQWNACIPLASGQAVAGSTLAVEIHWPGLRRGAYRLQVQSVRAPTELRWLGRFGCRGLMDGDHRFMLEPLGPRLTRVTQHEDFSGLLVPVFAPWLRTNVLRGFGLMNDALKSFVEQGPASTAPTARP